MNKRMRELLKTLDIPENAMFERDADSVVKSVNEKLNQSPPELALFKAQRVARRVAVICAVILALALTALAVSSSVNVDLLKLYFLGDSSYMERYVDRPELSLTDGRYRFTVDQALVTQTQAMAVFTVEALTEETEEELKDLSMSLAFDFKFADLSDYAQGGSSGTSELWHLRTDTSRTWTVTADIDNPDLKPMKMIFYPLRGKRTVIVEAKGDIESFEFDLAGQPIGDGHIVLTPTGITLDRWMPNHNDSYLENSEAFFRMKDGEIKSFNQLFVNRNRTSQTLNAEIPVLYQLRAIPREILDLSQIESVIVAGLEYKLRDPGTPAEAEIPERLRPFPVKIDGDYLEIEDIFEHLGADTERKGNKLTVRYNGIEAVITAGATEVELNGIPVSLSMPAKLDGDGKMLVCWDFTYSCIELNIAADSFDVPQNEMTFTLYP